MKNTFGDQDADVSVHESHVSRMVDYYKRTADLYNSDHGQIGKKNYGHNRAVEYALDIMRKTHSKTLLDVCCGTGRGVKAALENGFDAVGVDISPDLLERGTSELGLPKEKLRVADATRLPFQDNSFDVSCIFGALHHSARPSQIISEMIRVTRNAIVVSDGGNCLYGGLKRTLIKIGLFNPAYKLVFRRNPRTERRLIDSIGDGPAFAFSIEEIIPLLNASFRNSKSTCSYNIAGKETWSEWFPRIFARGVILTVWNKKK